MGWIDADGYIFLAGRKDDMIIRGGENIAPAEVEAVLYSHPGVDEAAVIGVPDVEWGQRVAAVVVPRPGVTLTADELIEFCRQRLASFKKPEVIHFVDALPKNQMGKILKKDLRAQLAEDERVRQSAAPRRARAPRPRHARRRRRRLAAAGAAGGGQPHHAGAGAGVVRRGGGDRARRSRVRSSC